MHELPTIESILDIALKHAARNNSTKIVSITIKVGELTDLQDNWLQHYFDYLSKETIAAGARLEIERLPIQLRCSACKTLIETAKEKLGEAVCPHCGAEEDLRIFSGSEYYIEEMLIQ